jgi:FixJ family two-component response regulator
LPDGVVISIVDDDASIREAMEGLMKSHGFDAQAFESAEAFLESDRCRITSCLIADVQMPGMTGVELHAHLKSSANPVPTILITAYPNDRVRRRALDAGVRCFLTKPFTEQDLLSCVRGAISKGNGYPQR